MIVGQQRLGTNKNPITNSIQEQRNQRRRVAKTRRGKIQLRNKKMRNVAKKK